ncbi:MAG: DUF4091 domain-containing protein [Cyclobacteriaceae bacterium]|nr:DUF4091 domain-containing protein [Cyclobacteriaceae bacterium]
MKTFHPSFLIISKSIRLTVLICFVACIFYGCDKTSDSRIHEILVFKAVDPLEKVFKETAFFREIESTAHVATGEHATFQFAVRCQESIQSLQLEVEELSFGENKLSIIKTGFVEYVSVGRNTPNHSRDKLTPVSGLYPDPIIPKEKIDLSAQETQPIWITVEIPKNTAPGLYEGQVTLLGKIDERSFEVSKTLKVKVYPVTIDNTRLWVTNWYNTSQRNLELIFGEKDIEPYSEKYWSFIQLLANKMAEYRQNVAIISPLRLAKYERNANGDLKIDFKNFDKTVEIFIEEGVIGRIEGGHIGTRSAGWLSDFVVFVPIIQEDTTIIEKFPISSDAAQAFYNSFIPALTAHLKEKGWESIYMQHLMDEPIPENIDTYTRVAKFIKKLAPDLKIVEACHSKDLDNTINIWVPQLDYMNIDYEFYRERANAGDEIWFYTCLNPKGEYANRFIELPLIKTRILHWINYRYDIPGYLHWGFNFWRGDPYDETTSIQLESGTILPGGDAWICYPGSGTIFSSIRLEAMRDGIVDYELLCMLGEKYPEEAAELARQIVYRFDYYDINIKAFREKRRRILELLSE